MIRFYRHDDSRIRAFSKNEEVLTEMEGVFADDKEFRSFAPLTWTRFHIFFISSLICFDNELF